MSDSMNKQATIERLRVQLAQAEAERDVLAAEVRAWRLHDDLHDCDSNTRANIRTHDKACEAAQRTDSSGALDRAKEAK